MGREEEHRKAQEVIDSVKGFKIGDHVRVMETVSTMTGQIVRIPRTGRIGNIRRLRRDHQIHYLVFHDPDPSGFVLTDTWYLPHELMRT